MWSWPMFILSAARQNDGVCHVILDQIFDSNLKEDNYSE